MRRAAALLAVAAAATVVVLLPHLVSDYHALELGKVAMYYVVLLGLAVLTGYSGQISLGQGAFMAIGAYTSSRTEHHRRAHQQQRHRLRPAR